VAVGLGCIVYPLVQFAISRKREYLADLGSVELTKDSFALISALQKIEGHSSVPRANKTLANFFIDTPNPVVIKETPPAEHSKNDYRGRDNPEYRKSQIATSQTAPTKQTRTSTIRDTHPSMDERISVLEQY
jgi:Zn-dependent protease with chaperone function